LNYETAVINQIFQETRKGERRRDYLTLVYEILLKLMPPDQHRLGDFWKSRFSDIPIDSLPFEPPSLSVCDIARAVNLREGRLSRYIHALKKNGLIVYDGGIYSITSKGEQVFATLDATLNHPLIRQLREDLEHTT
jgi:predicted transcriptional regulator